MKLDNVAQDFMNLLHNLSIFVLIRSGRLFFVLVIYCSNGWNQLTSIYFKIDKDNAAVEPRTGTLAASAMFLVVVAARLVYWMRFLKFAVVGMVGFLMGEAAVLGLYISLAALLTCITSMICIK
jgi:hypothetical protein